MAEGYGDWTDWLLCLGIAVLLGARLPMRNPEGHSPRYWKKHNKAPLVPRVDHMSSTTNQGQLSRGDTWTLFGVLVGVFFVIVLPPLYAKIPIFILVCVGLGWLAYKSHRVTGWSQIRKSACVVVVIAVCAVIAIRAKGTA